MICTDLDPMTMANMSAVFSLTFASTLDAMDIDLPSDCPSLVQATQNSTISQMGLACDNDLSTFGLPGISLSDLCMTSCNVCEAPQTTCLAPATTSGCTDGNANNFNPLATQDNGTCRYTTTTLALQSGEEMEGAQLSVFGVVVTGISANGVYAQPIEGGELNAIWSYTGWYGYPETLMVGDLVNIHGTYEEYNGLTELNGSIGPSEVVIVGHHGDLTPYVVDVGDVGEAHESLLISVENVHVVSPPNQWGEWVVADDDGMELIVDDQIYAYEGSTSEGTSFEYITGTLNYAYENFKLEPRGPEDLSEHPSICGDGACTGLETCESCVGDCGQCILPGMEPVLFITELADPNNDTGGRYVEIYNHESDPVPLLGWQLQRWTNGNNDPQSPKNLVGMIPANGFVIACAKASSFKEIYGVDCDIEMGTSGPAASNGDDQIALLFNDEIVDLFGVIGEDGSGTDHEFEDGRAERACVAQGNPDWDVSEWYLDNDSGGGDGPQNAPDDFDPFQWVGCGD